MGKSKGWACLLVFLFPVLLSMSIPVVDADSSFGSVVKIVSPTSSTYNRRDLLLNVTFTYGGLRLDLTYNLDGVMEGPIPMGEYRPPTNEFHLINTVFAWVNLPELTDGPHSVTVTLVARVYFSGGGKPSAPFQPTSPGSSEYSATWSDTVRFSVCADEPHEPQPQPNDFTPPKISNPSIHNQTYPSPDVPLTFTLNDDAFRLAYSLDKGDNVTIAGNTTLQGLVAGRHNVTVYSWDYTGNVVASQTVDFLVSAQESSATEQTEPGPTAWAAAALVAVLALSTAGVHGFKRLKKTKLRQ